MTWNLLASFPAALIYISSSVRHSQFLRDVLFHTSVPLHMLSCLPDFTLLETIQYSN